MDISNTFLQYDMHMIKDDNTDDIVIIRSQNSVGGKLVKQARS